MTRRALLRVIAGIVPLSFLESSFVPSFLRPVDGFKVRYVYKSPGMSSKELIERQRSLESLEVIERVNSYFRNNGGLRSFSSRATPETLIYDYVFSSAKVHDKWQTMMQQLKALDLTILPVQVTVVNHPKNEHLFPSHVDRQVTIEIA